MSDDIMEIFWVEKIDDSGEIPRGTLLRCWGEVPGGYKESPEKSKSVS